MIRLSHWSFRVFYLLICLSVAAQQNDEAAILAKMVQDSIKGEWYPLSNKTLPFTGFKMKSGRLHEADREDVAFTGWYSQFDANRTARLLVSFLEGKRQGVYAEWDELGNLCRKGEYFDGEKDGVFYEFSAQGKKVSQRNYLIGKLHGESVFWYDNGVPKLEALFEQGLIIEAKGWLSNGKKCPYTKVADGRGVIFDFGDGFLDALLQLPVEPVATPSKQSPVSQFEFGELEVPKP
jgi:antitoxin component YwqK of YwqJK toxin-antitoxin module